MTEEQYKLSVKSDAELHDWVIQHKPGTEEHTAGIRESMRRVAAMEELMEKSEVPVRKREKIAFLMAIAAILVAIAAIVVTYE